MRLIGMAMLLTLALATVDSSLATPGASRAASAHSINIREFYQLKSRMQKQFDSARRELQEQRGITHSQTMLYNQQTATVETQGKMLAQQNTMLEQQSKMIDQQIHLADQQSQLIEKQGSSLQTSVDRISFFAIMILVLGLALWLLTILAARMIYRSMRHHNDDDLTGREQSPDESHNGWRHESPPFANVWKSWEATIRKGLESARVFLSRLFPSWSSMLNSAQNPTANRAYAGSELGYEIHQVYDEILQGLDERKAGQVKQQLGGIYHGHTKSAGAWMSIADSARAGPHEQASALFNAALMAEDSQSIQYYNELIRRFGSRDDVSLLEWVAKALINKSDLLDRQGHHKEALTVNDEIVSRFGESVESSLRERAGKALLNKGVMLDTLGRHGEAIAAYRELISRYGDDAGLRMRERVARALMYIGDTLEGEGRYQDAANAYDEVAERFAMATDPALVDRVAMARNNKGCCLIRWARVNWSDKESRMQQLREARVCFTEAVERSRDPSKISGNLDYVLMLLGMGVSGRQVSSQLVKADPAS